MNTDRTGTDNPAAIAGGEPSANSAVNALIGLLIVAQIAALSCLGAAFGGNNRLPTLIIVGGTLAAVALVLAILAALASAGLRRRNASRWVAEQAAVVALHDALNRLGSGDLTATAEGATPMTANVAAAVNRFADRFRDLAARFAHTAADLAAATHDARATAIRLADVAQWQVREMANATGVGRDLVTTLGQVAAIAGAAAVTSRALAGAAAATTLTPARRAEFTAVSAQVQAVVGRLDVLDASVRQLGDRSLLVSDCSAHTRMLAMNAAIQVANADASANGGAGASAAGFAVIAAELQRLGERSIAVGHDLNALVRGVQSDTAAAVSALAVTASRAAVAVNADASTERDSGTGDIEALASELARRLHSVALVAHHQASAAGQLTAALQGLRDGAIGTLTDATHAIGVASELNDFAAELGASMDDLQLPTELTRASAGRLAAAVWCLDDGADDGEQAPRFTSLPAGRRADAQQPDSSRPAFPFADVFAASSATLAAMDGAAMDGAAGGRGSDADTNDHHTDPPDLAGKP